MGVVDAVLVAIHEFGEGGQFALLQPIDQDGVFQVNCRLRVQFQGTGSQSLDRVVTRKFPGFGAESGHPEGLSYHQWGPRSGQTGAFRTVGGAR